MIKNFAPCKIIQIPESRKFLLAESTQESRVESRIQDYLGLLLIHGERNLENRNAHYFSPFCVKMIDSDHYTSLGNCPPTPPLRQH